MNIGGNFSVTKDNHLALHGVDLVNLCAEYGTPLFVFDENCLIENFERFRKAFENVYPRVIVCYSVKTNNNLAICKILRERGAYAEVASELDLYIARKAGFSGDHIIFDGPYKPRKVLQKALKEGVKLINVESFAELERLDNVAGEMGVEQAVGLRINPFRLPNFLSSANPRNLLRAVYCYPRCRFGFSLEEVYLAFERAVKLRNLRVEGLMVHPYKGALKVLLPLMKEAYDRFGIEIRYLNIGGGFDPGVTRYVGFKNLFPDLIRQRLGLRSVLDEEKSVMDIEVIAKSVANDIEHNLGNPHEPIIVAEPGRFIVASSGILLLRVDHTKNAGGFRWVIVDGGTNLIPSIYERHKILIANKPTSPAEETVNIVGPLLYPEDFIAIKMRLPRVEEGDVVSVFDCGAYTLSSSNQFLYPRPAAILLNSKGEIRVIRERETFEDVLHKDKLSKLECRF